MKFDCEDNEEEEEEELVQKKIKIKTKASIVKQIKKKGIKVNEKVKFDDDGNVSLQEVILQEIYKFRLLFKLLKFK